MTGSGSGTDNRAHVSAMAVSTGTIWSPYAVTRRVSQFSREAAFQILPAGPLDAHPDLADGEGAEEELAACHAVVPGLDVAVGGAFA